MSRRLGARRLAPVAENPWHEDFLSFADPFSAVGRMTFLANTISKYGLDAMALASVRRAAVDALLAWDAAKDSAARQSAARGALAAYRAAVVEAVHVKGAA